MIPFEDIKHRLLGIRKDRKWLATQTNYSENTLRQYIGPSGKGNEDFLRKVSEAIEAEEFRRRDRQRDAPPWNLIFQTEEEFDRADRASRLVKAETLKEFCRGVILEKTDEILANQKRSTYRKLNVVASDKVAEDTP